MACYQALQQQHKYYEDICATKQLKKRAHKKQQQQQISLLQKVQIMLHWEWRQNTNGATGVSDLCQETRLALRQNKQNIYKQVVKLKIYATNETHLERNLIIATSVNVPLLRRAIWRCPWKTCCLLVFNRILVIWVEGGGNELKN